MATNGGASIRRMVQPPADAAPGSSPFLVLLLGAPVRYVGHARRAATETVLVTRLTLTLLGCLGVGYLWITKLIALACYSMLLMSGFVQVGYYYFFSSQVRRSIVYGKEPRNRLDLYLPQDTDDQSKPVVIFVTGGVWIIGYKGWGALLGWRLADRGVIVACLDYRNFPQGTISDMVKDTSQGISFVCKNIARYGGDPNRIYLAGQSAGAHIGCRVLVDQAIKEYEGESTTWSVLQIKAFFSISGRYNMVNLVDYFDSCGLYRSVFLRIMEGEESLKRFSPELVVQDPKFRQAVSLLCRIILHHGTSDYSIPSDSSKTFADALQSVGVQAEFVPYAGKTHTDLFLQDPLRGGRDELLENMISVIHAGDEVALAKDAAAAPERRLVQEFLLQMARIISPF